MSSTITNDESFKNDTATTASTNNDTGTRKRSNDTKITDNNIINNNEQQLMYDVLNDITILDNGESIRADIQNNTNTPYPYGQLFNIFNPILLQQVKDEVKQYSKVQFKESDLFRVYQSIDMANLVNDTTTTTTTTTTTSTTTNDTNNNIDRIGGTLNMSTIPSVYKLRDFLYSITWRTFIQSICNLQPNTIVSTSVNDDNDNNSTTSNNKKQRIGDNNNNNNNNKEQQQNQSHKHNQQIDCAFNCHTNGCHLLCHDDVIGTRKVSYIIYLTDIDWNTQMNGGSLELYNHSTTISSSTESVSIPLSIPTTLVQPIFNSIVFFVVQPGVSYHAVQEVFTNTTNPRLSLQGWYHTTSIPNNIQLATLHRLKQYNTTTTGNTIEQQSQSESSNNNEDTEGVFHLFENDDNDDNDNNDNNNSNNKLLNLSDNEIQYLQQYMNPIYLQESSIQNIQQQFEIDSSIQLRDFINTSSTSSIVDHTLFQSLLKDDDSKHRTILNTGCWTTPPITTKSSSSSNTGSDYDGTSTSAPVLCTTSTEQIQQYYTSGVTDEWQLVGPSHKQRFLQYVSPGSTSNKNDKKNQNTKETAIMKSTTASNTSTTSTGQILYKIQNELFQSQQFRKYLSIITSLGIPYGYRSKIRRFRPALDYTVAHYGILTTDSVLDATLCFISTEYNATTIANTTGGADATDTAEKVKAKNNKEIGETNDDEDNDDNDDEDDINESDIMWQSGDCGGFECYIAATDYDDIDDNDSEKKSTNDDKVPSKTASDAVAADEYNTNEENDSDDTELLSVYACNNTLSLVYRDPGTMRFIKYVTSNAPSSRWDIAMEYQVPSNDDDNDNDNEDNEEDDNNEEEEE